MEGRMKIVNIMNFVRTFEPRNTALEDKMVEVTRNQLRLINEMGLQATFLLEYDALTDERYLEIFREEAGENIELGLWYEVVEPLTTDIGIEYRSKMGYRWDWNIEPGYSMSYDNPTKERLIDRAMKTFREVFGYYPRTVGSWVIETHTLNYLSEHYDVDALCICRDQINTDAYTMIGGYFNGLYMPSRKNIFTPARTEEYQVNIPVIRLLGPDPIHNYDGTKHLSERRAGISTNGLAEPTCTVYTLEPACAAGSDPVAVDWFFSTFLDAEHLSHGYVQLGQENSFAAFDIIEPLRMQFEKVKKRDDLMVMKMGDTGRMFREKFGKTQPSAVTALRNWDDADCQSVCYSSSRYTVNVFRHDGVVALRYLYLFDERIEDFYLKNRCTTLDSLHENLPIIDTYTQRLGGDGGAGLILSTDARELFVRSVDGVSLEVSWQDGSATLFEDRIIITNCKAMFTPEMFKTHISLTDTSIEYEYKGHRYSLVIHGGVSSFDGETFYITGDEVTLVPTPGN